MPWRKSRPLAYCPGIGIGIGMGMGSLLHHRSRPGSEPIRGQPDGTRLHVTAGDGVDIIDTATNTVVGSAATAASVGGIAVVPSGEIYAVGNAGTVYVLDPQTNTVVDDFAVEPNSIGMTAAGDTVYITNPTSGTISVIDTATNTVESTVLARGEEFIPMVG